MTQGITYIIREDAGVQALIGQNKAASKYKVYPGVCDQPEQWPYTVVKILAKRPFVCRDGHSTRFTYTFAVISYDVNYLSAQAIDKAIFWAIDRKAKGTYNGVSIESIQFEDTKDDFVKTESFLHAKISTYTAIVNEDQAT